MKDLQTIAYVSRARIDEGDFDGAMHDIIEAAQRNNAADQITGVLVTSGCHFLQVLEGPVDPVRELMAKLQADPRHSDIRMIDDCLVRHRRYPDWSMRYAGLTRYALAFFSRLHLGISSNTDMAIVDVIIKRATC